MTQILAPSPTRRPAGKSAELDRLVRRTRRMWDREPILAGDEREAAICELVEVDLQLERIGLRGRLAPLDATDIAQIQDCSQRIQRLECHWVPEVTEAPDP